MYCYRTFGLYIHTAFILPELLVDLNHHAPDVVIQLGGVNPNGLLNPEDSGAFYQSNKNELWLNVPNVARYLIRNGQQIIIDPHDAIDETSLRVFLLGSCMGALLMQRDLLLLHANAIKVGEHCISFAGRSGIGKSTLSGVFMQRGYSILADDVCAINQQGEVAPSFPQIKLWADASKKLNIQTHALRKIRPQLEKFAVPLDAHFQEASLPLKVIYILTHNNQNKFEFNTVHGMKKILSLSRNTYRYQYLKGLGKTAVHLKSTGALASKISIVHVSRPKSGFQLNQLVDLIETDLSERDMLHA
jgi:hypothetical protein